MQKKKTGRARPGPDPAQSGPGPVRARSGPGPVRARSGPGLVRARPGPAQALPGPKLDSCAKVVNWSKLGDFFDDFRTFSKWSQECSQDIFINGKALP